MGKQSSVHGMVAGAHGDHAMVSMRLAAFMVALMTAAAIL